MYTDHYHFLHEALVEVKCVSLVEAAESLAALKSLVLANIEQWDYLLWPSNSETSPDFISKWIQGNMARPSNYPPAFQTMLAMLVPFFFCGYFFGGELVAGDIYILKEKSSVEGSPVQYLGFLIE